MMNTKDNRLAEKASKIKLLILDVDGVLTDGKISFTDNGTEYKTFHTQDGLGLKQLMKNNIQVAIISARSSPIVSRRMDELGIPHVYQGQHEKQTAFDELLTQLQLNAEQVAYVGDDLPDIPIMQQVGFSAAVNNAVADVKQIADWQTRRNGGDGAVREVCDFILRQQ